MDQKLPVIVTGLALLVVVGIWWQMQGPAPHEVAYQEERQVSEPAAAPAAKSEAAAPPRRSRERLRAKRDAWMEAREQQRIGNAPVAEPHRGMQSDRSQRAANAPGASEPPPAGALSEGGAVLGADRESVGPGTPAPANPRRRRALEEEFEELKHAALSDPDPDERINALWSLSVADEVGALPILASALRDGDREVRLAAVQELGGFEDEGSVVDALSVALSDDDPEVVGEAIRLIGDTEDARALSLARTLVNHPDADVREEAQSVIESLED